MVRGKRGLVRIIEATVAILIIISVLALFFNQQQEPKLQDYSDDGRVILEELSQVNNLRNLILVYDPSLLPPPAIPAEVQSFVDSRVPAYLNFQIRICEVDGACGIDYVEGNVWSSERVISTTIDQTTLTPKKIRLFIWENQV